MKNIILIMISIVNIYNNALSMVKNLNNLNSGQVVVVGGILAAISLSKQFGG